MILVSFYDEQIKYFMPPMLYDSRGDALRSIRNIVSRADVTLKENMYKHLIAYEIGRFDEETGCIIPCDHILLCKTGNFICEGKEFVDNET